MKRDAQKVNLRLDPQPRFDPSCVPWLGRHAYNTGCRKRSDARNIQTSTADIVKMSFLVNDWGVP
jgi:hypothetical protein